MGVRVRVGVGVRVRVGVGVGVRVRVGVGVGVRVGPHVDVAMSIGVGVIVGGTRSSLRILSSKVGLGDNRVASNSTPARVTIKKPRPAENSVRVSFCLFLAIPYHPNGRILAN